MDTMDTGHFVVSLSNDPARSRSPWKLEMRRSFAGKKIRRFFSTEGEAWAAGDEMVRKVREAGVDSLRERAGMSMRSATEAWEARHRGKSKSHREKAAKIAGELRGAFALVAVSPGELARWFGDVPGSPTTRAVVFRYVRGFFRWAHRMGYVARDPVLALDAPVATPRRNILDPEQMRALLEADQPDWLRWVNALGGFAGLRTEEIFRLRWEDVDPKAGEIFVSREVSVVKGRESIAERIVDFTPPLTRRAKKMPRKGPVCPIYRRGLDSARRALVASLGWVKWPENALRHSFATYHLADCKNPSATAHQMGHSSVVMVRRVYAVPARRADAAEWWAI